MMGDKSEVMVAKGAGISRTTLRNILGGGKVEFTSLEKLATPPILTPDESFLAREAFQ